MVFDLRLFVGPMSWLKLCLSQILLFSVHTTALCAPHVRVLTRTSHGPTASAVAICEYPCLGSVEETTVPAVASFGKQGDKVL